MTVDLTSSIVRILKPDGSVVGAGFLVSDVGLIATCAHVVSGALGLPDETSETPTIEVQLDFPLIAPGTVLNARVIVWQPKEDVAGLELDGDLPADAKAVYLVTAENLWGHAFRAFGFPRGHKDGVWASGVLRERQAVGWVQIEDVKDPGYRVQPGFSGGPVWDEQLNSVVGMVVAADVVRDTKAAYMIPTSLLVEALPRLAEHSLDASSVEYLREQLTMLEVAQQDAPDPHRFQSKIDELQYAIANWDGRVEAQRQRIADGLEERRQQIAESVQRRDEKRVRIVGRRPQDVVDFFKNRLQEQETIGQLLAEPTTRLVSVIGHGGMGKTALACKVLRDLERHHWPHTDDDIPLDGIVYLSTRTAGISLERLFLDCAKVLGGEQEERLNAIWTNPQIGAEDKVSRLLDALNEGRYVVLLDNIEDLLDDGGQLTEEGLRLFFEQGLMTAQGAQLMVTSRVALTFRREVLRFDRQVKLLEGLPTEEGVALLRELDPNGDYGLRDAREEQLAEAVDLAHGVPRALEVLAGILANDPFATLDEVLETFYEQEDVVQALIEETYQRLDRDARLVIEALAVFKKPVPVLAVDYLLEPFAPGLDVPGILRRLTRTNIVSVDRAVKTVTLHPIDQDYAYSQLPEEEQTESAYTRQALERRAADYYIQLRTPEETWKSIEDLEPQLNEFEHRVRAGDYPGACQVLEQLDENYLFLWGHYIRLVEMREMLCEPLSGSTLEMGNLGRLGKAYYSLGKFEESIRLYEDALKLARDTGDCRGESNYLSALGQSYRTLRQAKRAIGFLNQALDIAGKLDDLSTQGEILGLLGRTYHDIGDLRTAEKMFGDALKLYEAAEDVSKEALIGLQKGRLGLLYLDLGEVGKAIIFLEQALSIANSVNDPRRKSAWFCYLGDAYQVAEQIEKAIELQQEGLTLVREIYDRRGESTHLGHLGFTYRCQKDYDKAIYYHQSALEIARETGYRQDECLQLLWLGLAWLAKGEKTQAKAFFDEAAAACQAMLDDEEGLYLQRYAVAAAHMGSAACDQDWNDETERAKLLAAARTKYHQALDHCSAKGIVKRAKRDLELIRAAGIEGLEPVFELLESVLEV